jgi:hypothetical protein
VTVVIAKLALSQWVILLKMLESKDQLSPFRTVVVWPSPKCQSQHVRCFAWLDCNVAHFGAARNGPCISLHASVKHKTHLDGIGEPDAVHVVDIFSLMKKKQEEGQMHLALLLKMSSQTNTHH